MTGKPFTGLFGALLLACGLGGAAVAAPVLAPVLAPASPYILIDADSGQVLAEREPYQLWYPASVTKLMTAYLVFEALESGALKPTSPVKMSANALAEPPSKMGYPVGTLMTIDNALMMLLVHSANDIAVALGETVSVSESAFVARMNATAKRLGMVNTHYDNPNGLPSDGQLTTARDLAVLSRAVWNEYPRYRPLFSIPAIRSGKQVLRSPNSLLDRYAGSNGMKTGFICAAGYNMVASATRDGRTLIAVVLGALTPRDRAELAAQLLDRGFSGGALLSHDLEGAQNRPSSPVAVNIRDAVCGKNRPANQEEAEGDIDTSIPALGQRFRVTDPIVVTTGLPGDQVPKTTLAAKPVEKPAAKPVPKIASQTAAVPAKESSPKNPPTKSAASENAADGRGIELAQEKYEPAWKSPNWGWDKRDRDD